MIPRVERADARANRRRLIAAAHELFRERGLDAEMKEIAERAGLGIGTIYRNFPTKDDLVAAIIGEAITELRQFIDEAAAVEDPIEALRLWLHRGCEISERYGVVLMSVLGGTMPADCREQFAKIKEENQISEVIQAGIARGIFRSDIDPDIVAHQVTSAFVPWSYQELRRTRTPEEIANAYLDLILRGVLIQPEGQVV
jgi:AcrR family transcriptional regulator